MVAPHGIFYFIFCKLHKKQLLQASLLLIGIQSLIITSTTIFLVKQHYPKGATDSISTGNEDFNELEIQHPELKNGTSFPQYNTSALICRNSNFSQSPEYVNRILRWKNIANIISLNYQLTRVLKNVSLFGLSKKLENPQFGGLAELLETFGLCFSDFREIIHHEIMYANSCTKR